MAATSRASETHEIARAGIGWVPDDRRLCPTLTVARNLAHRPQADAASAAWTVKVTCEIFSPLEYLMEREAEKLSGGEMQMVAIARALLGAPGLVLFDEPSQGLAPKIVDDVIGMIGRMKEEGIASIVVEQNADVALSVADQRRVLRRGQIVWAGEAATLFVMTRAAPAPAGSAMMATPLLALEQRREDLQARALSIAAPDIHARSRSRVLDEPEIVGVIGPNGAGKTTLFEMMAGSNAPTAGRVWWPARTSTGCSYRERDRLAIHYHQSYQVRRFRKTRAVGFAGAVADRRSPMVHLFDEPQFNMQDGYIGFMLDFFRKLRAEGRLVFALHASDRGLASGDTCRDRRTVSVCGGWRRRPDRPTSTALSLKPRFRSYLGPDMTKAAEEYLPRGSAVRFHVRGQSPLTASLDAASV